MEDKVLLEGELTIEKLAELKKKYATLFEFRTDYGVAYFRKPNRLDLKAATDGVQQGLSEYNDIIAANCFIEKLGDEIIGCARILEDPEYYNALSNQMSELAKGKQATLVKL